MFIRSNTHRALSYIFAFVALGLLLGYDNAFAATSVGTVTEIPGMKGKVTINDRGKAKIHTYAFSPLNSTTHIIETADGLVVVDAQMTLSDTAFRRTASLALRSRTSRAVLPTSCRKAKS